MLVILEVKKKQDHQWMISFHWFMSHLLGKQEVKQNCSFNYKSCSQMVWMKYKLEGNINFENHISIYCDNPSVINLSKKLIKHSKNMHIKIKHNFIIDYVNN